jgi:hypothetical protein
MRVINRITTIGYLQNLEELLQVHVTLLLPVKVIPVPKADYLISQEILTQVLLKGTHKLVLVH